MAAEQVRTRGGDAGARVADVLRDEILDGVIAPGTRLRQEDIAERLDASRVPVREALRILESDGLVRLVANTGAWVSTLALEECEEIYRMREVLEPLLLGYSAPGLGVEHLRRLSELAAEMERTDDVGEFVRMDREFHLGFYDGADTAHLGDLVRRLWNTTHPYRRAYMSSLGSSSGRIMHDEHHLLVSAVSDGDLEDAGRTLAAHIRRTRRALSRHPDLFVPS